MITLEQMGNLKKGDVVDYAFFKNVKIENISKTSVTLKDSDGNLKQVFASLFMRHGMVQKK